MRVASQLGSPAVARARLRGVAVLMAVALALPACGLLHRHREPAPPEVYDLNHASLRKLETLPGITPSMARRMVDGRPYRDPHDLVTRGILTEREYRRVEDRLRVEAEGGH